MGMMLNLKDDQTRPMGTLRSGFDSSFPPRARCAGCMTCLPSRPKPKPSPACHARTVCTVLVIVLASASAFPLYSFSYCVAPPQSSSALLLLALSVISSSSISLDTRKHTRYALRTHAPSPFDFGADPTRFVPALCSLVRSSGFPSARSRLEHPFDLCSSGLGSLHGRVSRVALEAATLATLTSKSLASGILAHSFLHRQPNYTRILCIYPPPCLDSATVLTAFSSIHPPCSRPRDHS